MTDPIETTETPEIPTTHPEFVALVRSKLDTAGFTDIEFRANDAGEYAVLGPVSTKGEQEQVREVLNDIGDDIKRRFCGMRGI